MIELALLALVGFDVASLVLGALTPGKTPAWLIVMHLVSLVFAVTLLLCIGRRGGRR